jgi:homopolymeric O-antigen transport system ATP-binding protein
MQAAIKVRDLGKRYRVGEREPYRTLRESVVEAASAPFRAVARRFNGAANGRAPAADDHVWALHDVSFDVAPGEVLGVIGRNGAGKSTLLKVLSRITEPTTGRVELYGRVGSLLEVGTGFHPELTGRENVHLSGAILGMKRGEIERKFDEIVAFAEVEKFIDTPVKRYSSGMYVRLAFAVAAFLEPEILLVDEVLAVGDVAFQKRCLGRIGDVARQGRTVLFVSHNMASIESLCSSCILVRDGAVAARGAPGEVVSRYMATELKSQGGSRSLRQHPGRRPGSTPTITRVALFSDSGKPQGTIRMGAPLQVHVGYKAERALRPVLGITVKSGHGGAIFCASDRFQDQLLFSTPRAEATVICEFERLLLMPGTYQMDLWLGDANDDIDVIHDAISFEMIPADLTGTGRLPPSWTGPVFQPATFRIKEDAN